MLFVSDICWGSLTQRPQHIAARLARRTPLLWIEPITLGHPWRLRPVEVAPMLQILSVPQIPLNARAAWMRALARVLVAIGPLRILFERLQATLVRRALRAMGWGPQPSAAVVQNFQLMDLVRRLGVGRIVFDYIDDSFGFARLPPVVERQWQQTIESANSIGVTSPRLRRLIE